MVRAFILILLMFISYGYSTNSNSTIVEDVSLIENILHNDYLSNSDSSSELYIQNEFDGINNNIFDPTSINNIYNSIWTNFNRINKLLTHESLFLLKNLIKIKSTLDFIQAPTSNHSAISLYKLLNSCDYYTYHNHRIII